MTLKCEFCPETFTNEDALNKHLRERHGDKVKLTIIEHPFKPKTRRKKTRPKRANQE